VRLPFYWVLDEKCRISGCHIIREAVRKLVAEEGLDTYKRFTREVLEDTRQAFVNRIKEFMVPGVYQFRASWTCRTASTRDVCPSMRRSIP